LKAELITGELTVGGLARSFALRLPRGASDGIPLVLVLHGNHPEATGLMMREWTTFDEQADAFGFAVAYPDGIGGCRADGRGVTTADEAGVDDVAFLRALIDTSAGRHAHHRVLQPEHDRLWCRRDADRHLDGVGGRSHLARSQAVPRSRRDGTP
jgi:poly(3-hydroxybutyrate) depolymerase